LSFSKGAHVLKFGGSLARLQDSLHFAGTGSFVRFLSWPDFLLGLDGAGNGTGTFSNVFQSTDSFGLLDREFRVWEGSGFVQDDYRIAPSLTLNLGVRYERLGQFGDALGRNASFDSTGLMQTRRQAELWTVIPWVRVFREERLRQIDAQTAQLQTSSLVGGASSCRETANIPARASPCKQNPYFPLLSLPIMREFWFLSHAFGSFMGKYFIGGREE
jgi:hypothetical protein